MASIRLQRFLAQAGVAARRKSEQLIVSGVVQVNGKVVTVLGTKVDPNRDKVTVNGAAVAAEEFFYCLLNKPGGCVTTVSDPHGRRTVMEYLSRVPAHVVPVGRLDFYSEGVLLLTNDGDLAAALLSPARHVEKTYHVKVRGGVTDANLKELRRGVRLDRRTTTLPAQVDRLPSKSRHDWLVITLTEGKSRQIRRMMEALGREVVKLQRVAFAGLSFHGMRVGDARELTQAELNSLLAMVGMDRGDRRSARGKWKVVREDTELARRARDRERPVREKPAPAIKPGRRDLGRGEKKPRGPSKGRENASRGAARPGSGTRRPKRR